MRPLSVVLPEVLDLGEDGDAWAIAGHYDRRSAIAAVLMHAVGLGTLADLVEWSPVEALDVTHKRGRWSGDDPDIDGAAWIEDALGEPWTFVA